MCVSGQPWLEVLEDPAVKSCGNAPDVVKHAVRALVAKVGLQAVREVYSKNIDGGGGVNGGREAKPAVDNLLHEVVRWKANGWDR